MKHTAPKTTEPPDDARPPGEGPLPPTTPFNPVCRLNGPPFSTKKAISFSRNYEKNQKTIF